MIIIGYQGIGKSTLAGKNGCIDLESGNFWVDGKRADDWYVPYCQIANHLSQQGYTVFVSSHEVVRNELLKSGEHVVAIVPSPKLKDEWIKKLKDRYERTGLEKDFKAWKNAEDRYVENIIEIAEGCYNTIVLYGMDYILSDVIASIVVPRPIDIKAWNGELNSCLIYGGDE